MEKKLYLIWRDSDIIYKTGLLTKNNKGYTFEYTNYEFNDLQIFSKNGLFPGFLDINKVYFNESLFPSILNRLPSLSRIDYEELLNRYGVENKEDLFEILTKTKGEHSSDNFLFVTQDELQKLEDSNKVFYPVI